jgi:hypothetical protein
MRDIFDPEALRRLAELKALEARRDAQSLATLELPEIPKPVEIPPEIHDKL